MAWTPPNCISIGLAFVLASAGPVLGQGAEPEKQVEIPRLPDAAEPPTIDGHIDDEAWSSATVVDDFRQAEPEAGGVPSQRTRMLVMYDASRLYVAFHCYDDPDQIIATQMERDADLDSDDRVAFVLDPYFDRRNGFYFEVNPLGAKRDGLVEQNRALRIDWDGIWYGKSQIVEDGWTAEIAIPMQTISFSPETTRWGFNAQRRIRRTNEEIRWTGVQFNQSLLMMADAGAIGGIADIEGGLGLDFKPYGKIGYERNDGDDSFPADAGFDLVYRLTPGLTAQLTVNTDFAETEADLRRTNLTRFPLFFPEKRDFFLQDAGIFNFGGIRRSPLPFFSRRIGLADGGKVDILAGLKLTGRTGPWTIGVLDVQTDERSAIDRQNLFVGRVKHDVLEESEVGAIFTNGDQSGSGHNSLAGFDFNFQRSDFQGDKVLTASTWFQITNSNRPGDSTAAGARISYPNDRVRWSAGFAHIGKGYDPALGFVSRRGIREHFGNWRYRWRPGNTIRTIDSGFFGMLITNTANHLETFDLSLDLIDIEFESGDSVSIGADRTREVLNEPFEIAEGVVIPTGTHDWDRFGVGFETSEGRPVSVGGRIEDGEFWTGDRLDIEGVVDWRVSRHLVLGAEYEMNDIDLPEGDFIVRTARARVKLQFSPDLIWSTLIQYDNLSESVGVNSRLRWIIEPGNELFFVWNQAYDVDSTFRPEFTELVGKVGWTFRF